MIYFWGPLHIELLFGAKYKSDINDDTVAQVYPCSQEAPVASGFHNVDD